MIAVFVVLRLIATLHPPVTSPDTASYRALDFLGSRDRLWTVPLMWKIFPGPHLREAVQIVVCLVAWSLLALVLSRLLINRWVRWVAVAAVLMLGLMIQITWWDTALRSESLATSLLVMLVALLLWLFIDSGNRTLAAVIAVAVLWVFTRQSNAMLYLALLPFLIFWTVRTLNGRRAVSVGLALLILGAWGGTALTRNTRTSSWLWKYNSVQVLLNRIALDPSALHYFVVRGLPQPSAFAVERGHFAGVPSLHSPLWHDRSFMAWISHHFRSTYLSFLVSHPSYLIERPLIHTPRFVSERPDRQDGDAEAVLPSSLSDVFWATREVYIVVWLVVAVVIAVLAYARGLRFRAAPLSALLLLASAFSAVIIYNTVGGDLGRVFLPVGLMLRLGILITVASGLDVLVMARRRGAVSGP